MAKETHGVRRQEAQRRRLGAWRGSKSKAGASERKRVGEHAGSSEQGAARSEGASTAPVEPPSRVLVLPWLGQHRPPGVGITAHAASPRSARKDRARTSGANGATRRAGDRTCFLRGVVHVHRLDLEGRHARAAEVVDLRRSQRAGAKHGWVATGAEAPERRRRGGDGMRNASAADCGSSWGAWEEDGSPSGVTTAHL